MAKSAAIIRLTRYLGKLAVINRISRNRPFPILFGSRKNNTSFLVHLLKAHVLALHHMFTVRKSSRFLIQFQGIDSIRSRPHINDGALSLKSSDEGYRRVNNLFHAFD